MTQPLRSQSARMRPVVRAGWAVLLFACGGTKAATTPTSARPTAAVDLAPHYAALFERGRVWPYTMHIERSGEDGGRVELDVQARCKVDEVRSTPGRVESTISCDQSGTFNLDTTWVALPTGLWQDADTSIDDRPLIAARPTEERTTEGDFTSTVTRVEDAWCRVARRSTHPDTCASVCFTIGGIVSYAVVTDTESSTPERWILTSSEHPGPNLCE